MVGDVNCELVFLFLSGHGGSAISCWWLPPSMCTSSWAVLGGAAGMPTQPCPQEQRVTGRHCQLLGCFWWIPSGSPFPQQCICCGLCPQKAPSSLLQTQEHRPLVRPACAGGFVGMLSVLNSLGWWIHQVCQSPEPSSLWEHSTDLLSFVQSLNCCFPVPISVRMFTGTCRGHSSKLTQGGSWYNLVPFDYVTLRAKKVKGPSLRETPRVKATGCNMFYLPLLPPLLGAAPPHAVTSAISKANISFVGDSLVWSTGFITVYKSPVVKRFLITWQNKKGQPSGAANSSSGCKMQDICLGYWGWVGGVWAGHTCCHNQQLNISSLAIQVWNTLKTPSVLDFLGFHSQGVCFALWNIGGCCHRDFWRSF